VKPAWSGLSALLDPLQIVALCLLAATSVFSLVAVKPLEERLRQLDLQLAAGTKPFGANAPVLLPVGNRAERLSAFYEYFDRAERPEDWLAKLYGTAVASNLDFRSGQYRRVGSAQRMERYHITLPVTGTYSQIRVFLQTALAEIPLLSLDHVNFRRKAAGESQIEAEITMTLHVLQR
jgi:hypothetical protein